MDAIRQRNPLAFQPKIENGPSAHNVRKVPSSNRILNTCWLSLIILSNPVTVYVSFPYSLWSLF